MRIKYCSLCPEILLNTRCTYCPSCKKIKNEEHKEQNRIRCSTWMKENREYNKKKCLEWYKNNKEYADQRHKEYLSIESNRVRRNEWLRKWNTETRNLNSLKRKAWSKANLEEFRLRSRVKQHRRRLKMNGSFTRIEWIQLLTITGESCLCCGSNNKIEMDHIKPIFIGGRNDICNIQPLCKTCNMKKRTQYFDYRTEDMIKDITILFSSEMRVKS